MGTVEQHLLGASHTDPVEVLHDWYPEGRLEVSSEGSARETGLLREPLDGPRFVHHRVHKNKGSLNGGISLSSAQAPDFQVKSRRSGEKAEEESLGKAIEHDCVVCFQRNRLGVDGVDYSPDALIEIASPEVDRLRKQ